MKIIGSLLQNRESFLSRPDWMQRPWKIFPKSPVDELIDPLFHLLPVFRQFDEIIGGTSQALRQRGLRDIIAKSLEVESTIRTVYANFEKSVSGPLYWSQLSSLESRLDDTTLGRVFPISLHFPAFLVAEVMTTYWSSMMTVHKLLMHSHEILASIERCTSSTHDVNGLPQQSDGVGQAASSELASRVHGDAWRVMARNLCQSVEFFLQDKMGGLASLSMLLLLRGCKSCFETDVREWSREIGWISDFIKQIQMKFDFPISKLLD